METNLEFSIIVAIDDNRGIGKDGKIPWKNKEDLRFFKELTNNGAIIMGRMTFESIGKILPNRINIVISRQKNNENRKDSPKLSDSLDSALDYCKNNEIDKIFVIGGEMLYRTAIIHPLCRYLYLSRINGEYNCDRFFPKTDQFTMTEEIKISSDSQILKVEKYESNLIHHQI